MQNRKVRYKESVLEPFTVKDKEGIFLQFSQEQFDTGIKPVAIIETSEGTVFSSILENFYFIEELKR